MYPVLRNTLDNEEFLRLGYVRMPLLSLEEVGSLLSVFEAYSHNYQQPFHTSHFSTDKNYKQRVNDFIAEVLQPHLERVFNNYKSVFGNWMIKTGEGNNEVPLHADWTYVDESKYRSIAFWIPLIDTNIQNGCFGLIPGSHRISPSIRGPRIIQGNWQNYERWIKTVGQLIPMKAGEAIIYDHALLHFSPPNISGKMRPALNLSCIPTEALLFHYCIPEGTELIRKYMVDDPSFFIHYDNFQVPERGDATESIKPESVPTMDAGMENFISRIHLSTIIES